MSTQVKGATLVMAMLLFAGCGGGQQEIVPTVAMEPPPTVADVNEPLEIPAPTMTASLAPTNTPTAVEPPTETTTITPTDPPTNTPTASMTPTSTPTVVPHIIAAQNVNIRTGPGVIYEPPLGVLLAGEQALLLGWNTADNGQHWWNIICSSGIVADGCWVSGSPYTQGVNSDSVPLVQAPPTPTAIPSLIPTASSTPTTLPIIIGAATTIAEIPLPTPTRCTGTCTIFARVFSIETVQMVACPVTLAKCENTHLEDTVPLNATNTTCLLWVEDGERNEAFTIQIYREGVLQVSLEEISVGGRVCRAAQISSVSAGTYETVLSIGGFLKATHDWIIR